MLLFFFGKIGCNGRLFVFLDKNNYFFKKTLFYFFVGYFILWKSLTLRISRPGKGEFKVTLTREPIVNPQLAEVYYNRGLARLELKDKQGAREDLQKAADLYQQQNNIEMYQTALEKLKEIQ
ncbi:MAG: tetratricopeptide repeat protein [Microcystis sp. M20BS1]|uniref:tetratricopeptide repeat protein n=1 Tax=Microcystis TaxID=1125 RepID=UPI00161C9A38|nr:MULTISPECIES: tetratricopeptide repeat protein [Microcystis]MCA2625903.1 tetratricopeptide repeat protein [Microcystis sp. M19BS1]MCA2634967.1 tetratricopeptide repeat protein [Microcystis sp. M20BS1]